MNQTLFKSLMYQTLFSVSNEYITLVVLFIVNLKLYEIILEYNFNL